MGLHKRIFRSMFTAVLLGALLTGCGSRQSENMVFDSVREVWNPETELSFFGFKYEALNVTAIEEALQGYMDACPDVSISYDGIKSPEYFEVLEKRVATGNADDVFMVDHERALELGSQGKLEDLSGLSTLDSFSDLARSQMFSNGAVYYVPTSISAFGFYCNLDLLNEHGQAVPKNYSELRAVCDYFVSEGIAPIVANNDISLKTVAIAKAMLPIYQSGHTEEDIARLNSGETDLAAELQSGFALVEEMLNRGWIDAEEALQTAKTRDDLELFAQGKRPFMLTGAWAVPRLRDLQPDFRFEVHPYPILEDGSVLVINVDTRISIYADSPDVEQARKFVEFMTRNDVIWEFVESQSSFSPLKENRLAGDAAIQPVGPYLNNGRCVLGSDDNLNLPIWDMTRRCIVEMLEGGDAESASELMKQQIKDWRLTGRGGAE